MCVSTCQTNTTMSQPINSTPWPTQIWLNKYYSCFRRRSSSSGWPAGGLGQSPDRIPDCSAGQHSPLTPLRWAQSEAELWMNINTVRKASAARITLPCWTGRHLRELLIKIKTSNWSHLSGHMFRGATFQSQHTFLPQKSAFLISRSKRIFERPFCLQRDH